MEINKTSCKEIEAKELVSYEYVRKMANSRSSKTGIEQRKARENTIRRSYERNE